MGGRESQPSSQSSADVWAKRRLALKSITDFAVSDNPPFVLPCRLVVIGDMIRGLCLIHPSLFCKAAAGSAGAGLGRSIAVYYGNPIKLRRMRRFYAQFIQPGDLCFDIGAHVGNRVLVWSRLGARIVAVEPQPACLALLRRLYGRSPRVTLVDQAVGAAAGRQALRISRAHPTVTTLSQSWIEAVQASTSFAGVEWEETTSVDVTTLDDAHCPFWGAGILQDRHRRVRGCGPGRADTAAAGAVVRVYSASQGRRPGLPGTAAAVGRL